MLNTTNATTTIINTPETLDAEEYPFIVARACEGSVWYYGSYRTQEKAHEVAEKVDGFVLWID